MNYFPLHAAKTKIVSLSTIRTQTLGPHQNNRDKFGSQEFTFEWAFSFIDSSRVYPTCTLIWNLVPSFESCRVHVPAAFHRLWENFENWFSFSSLCIFYFLFVSIVFHRLWENCANWFSRFCILYFIGSEKTLQTDFLVLLCVYCV